MDENDDACAVCFQLEQSLNIADSPGVKTKATTERDSPVVASANNPKLKCANKHSKQEEQIAPDKQRVPLQVFLVPLLSAIGVSSVCLVIHDFFIDRCKWESRARIAG